MKRRLFSILSLISFVLLVWYSMLWLTPRKKVLILQLSNGVSLSLPPAGIGYEWNPPDPHHHGFRVLRVAPNRFHSFAGFIYIDGAATATPRGVATGPATPNYLLIVIPYWFPVAITAILPLIWGIDRFHRGRAKARSVLNHCPVCNYDLRATPDRCPECGRPPTIAGAQ